MAFQKGQSGNPAGKPRGTVNAVTRLRRKLATEVPAIMSRMVRAALDGDVQAARLILERTVPSLKPEAAAVRFPGVQGAPLSERAGAILVAIAEGKIPPDTGAVLLSALANTVKVIELAVLAERLERLEAVHVGG